MSAVLSYTYWGGLIGPPACSIVYGMETMK